MNPALHGRRRSKLARSIAAISLAAAAAVTTSAGAIAAPKPYFQHLGTFDIMAGNGSTVAEIIDASGDGRQVIYTDSPNEQIGFVWIANPSNPRGQGTVDVGGEPTSLAIFGRLVIVAVNTSESFTNPSGKLVVVDRISRNIVAEFPLDGQPDSIALSPDRKRAAIVIENERDEDLDGGILPQAPTGKVLIVDMRRPVARWQITEADLTPVIAAASHGDDLEPEFVDINDNHEAVVTFQENNHIAVIDLKTGQTTSQFPLGTVVLNNVDTNEEDIISLDSTIERRREPDGVAWIDNDHFAIANEGDYEDEFGEEGGSRGFTIFDKAGNIVYESAEAYEHWLITAGHYNETRSENKGVEPEGTEFARFGRDPLLFIGSERANAVGVYNVADPSAPQPVQILPTAIGPEGLKAIPKRNLFVASSEKDEADAGIPAFITIFGRNSAQPPYPMIESGNDGSGLPIPWVALSGLAADPADADTLYTISDSFLAKPFIYTVDVSSTPARIVDRLEVTGASEPEGLDLEGIAIGPDGTFWLASEGDAVGGRNNLLIKVDPITGAVLEEIGLPAGMIDGRRKNGFEGIAVTGTAGAEVIYAAIQRAWPNEGDTDKVETKIGRYDVASDTWTFVHYPLEAERDGDWIGLSELSLLPNGQFVVIERDKGWGTSTGPIARLKALYRIDLANADFRAYDDVRGLVTVSKRRFRNVLRQLENNSIWTAEKLEGFTVAADGRMYAVTDNDGVDGATGETVFLNLGQLPARLMR